MATCSIASLRLDRWEPFQALDGPKKFEPFPVTIDRSLLLSVKLGYGICCQSESGLFLTVTVIADFIESKFVLFIGDYLLAGVPNGNDALDGQVLRKSQELGDILR